MRRRWQRHVESLIERDRPPPRAFYEGTHTHVYSMRAGDFSSLVLIYSLCFQGNWGSFCGSATRQQADAADARA